MMDLLRLLRLVALVLIQLMSGALTLPRIQPLPPISQSVHTLLLPQMQTDVQRPLRLISFNQAYLLLLLRQISAFVMVLRSYLVSMSVVELRHILITGIQVAAIQIP